MLERVHGVEVVHDQEVCQLLEQDDHHGPKLELRVHGHGHGQEEVEPLHQASPLEIQPSGVGHLQARWEEESVYHQVQPLVASASASAWAYRQDPSSASAWAWALAYHQVPSWA